MKIRVWWALARGVVIESSRRKELYVVAILGFLIIAASGMLGFFGMDGLQSFAKDLASTVLGGFGTVMAIVVSSRLVPEEIKNRTLYPLMARPITRLDFLMGKLLGAILVSWIGFLALAALTGVALLMFRVQFEPVMLQYLLGKLMGLALLCTMSLTLSCWMTPSASITMSFVLAFGSSMISRSLILGYEHAGPSLQPIFKAVNAALPQFTLFDFGSRAAATGWGLVPAWVFGALLAYLAVYGGSLLGLSWFKFQRQAL